MVAFANSQGGVILLGVSDQGDIEGYFRPTEVEQLLGDPTKAKEKLGWERKYSLEELVKEMVQADLIEAKKDKHLQEGGFVVNKNSE